MGWLTGWNYRKQVTISHTNVDSDLTDFPLLVHIDGDTDFGANTQAAGQDLRFTLSDGSTLLSYEIEGFSITAGAATGWIWVKIPALSSSSDTTIYAYYGKSDASDGQQATSVWDANFKGVWHLKETTGVNNADSTTNGNTGTPTNGPTQVAGEIDGALSFDGTNDYVDAGNTASLSLGSTGTVSFWWMPTTAGVRSGLVSKGDAVVTDKNGYVFRYQGGGDGMVLEIASASAANHFFSNTHSFTGGVWYHTAGTWDGSTITLYTNGAFDGSLAQTVLPKSDVYNLVIGAENDNSGGHALYHNGKIDDVRISSAARSAAWIKFEYQNMASATNELTFGTQEAMTQEAMLRPALGGRILGRGTSVQRFGGRILQRA